MKLLVFMTAIYGTCTFGVELFDSISPDCGDYSVRLVDDRPEKDEGLRCFVYEVSTSSAFAEIKDFAFAIDNKCGNTVQDVQDMFRVTASKNHPDFPELDAKRAIFEDVVVGQDQLMSIELKLVDKVQFGAPLEFEFCLTDDKRKLSNKPQNLMAFKDNGATACYATGRVFPEICAPPDGPRPGPEKCDKSTGACSPGKICAVNDADMFGNPCDNPRIPRCKDPCDDLNGDGECDPCDSDGNGDLCIATDQSIVCADNNDCPPGQRCYQLVGLLDANNVGTQCGQYVCGTA
jgi:hypothetical protein